MLDGEYNETDVSGPCRVLYETISTEVFRKIKVREHYNDYKVMNLKWMSHSVLYGSIQKLYFGLKKILKLIMKS